jgi:hypothetical protein
MNGSPHRGEALEAAHKHGSERIVRRCHVFRMCRRQIEAEFDRRFEFLRVKGKAENTIDARHSEGIIPLGRGRECNDGHLAGDSHFADLVDGLDSALRARFKAWSGEQIVGSEDHEVKFFTTGFMREFIKANRPGGLDGGAVVAEVQNHDFNHVANTAIRIANQKVERFHQFEKNATAWWNGRNACVPARGKARSLPTRTLEKLRKGRDRRTKVGQKCSGSGQ